MTLESRLPEIIAQLPDHVQEGMVDGLKPIARAMGAAAPDTSDDEAREFSAGPVTSETRVPRSLGETDNAAAIFSEDWYWFFAEYGTVKEPARPFMRPALEAGKEHLYAAITRKLGDL
jgi:HK97 gp10 family phage protein